MTSIPFRHFDVLGDYPTGFNHVQAISVGYAFVRATGASRIAICGDRRPSTPKLIDGLVRGALAAGAHVFVVPQGSKEMLTYAVGAQMLSGGLYVTAGGEAIHKNGVQFVGEDCSPVPPSVVADIKEKCNDPVPEYVADMGTSEHFQVFEPTMNYLTRVILPYGEWPPKPGETFTVVLDEGLSNTGQLVKGVLGLVNVPDHLKVFYIEDVLPDASTSPSAEAPDRVVRMGQAMEAVEADLGLSWDASGTAMRLYGRDGNPRHPALTGAYIAAAVGQRHAGEAMVCDQPVVFPLYNTCAHGGNPFAVGLSGQARMENMMRGANATVGLESNGTIYFRELWWSESGALAGLLAIHMAYLSPKPICGVLDDLAGIFPITGPHLIPVEHAAESIARVAKAFASVGKITWVEGEIVCRSTSDKDWRFVVRPVGTHLMSLTVEGRNLSQEQVCQVSDNVIGFLQHVENPTPQ